MFRRMLRLCLIPKKFKEKKNIKKNNFLMFDSLIKKIKIKLFINLYIIKLFNFYIDELKQIKMV